MVSHTKPEYTKRYIEQNREKIAAAKKLAYQKKREDILARQKAWRKENPEKQREIARRARERRKEAASAEQKRWREANPDKVAAALEKRKATPKYQARKLNERLRKFGITGEQYAAMVTAQNNKCGSCGTDRPSKRSAKRWAVDHCHTSGAVRGLLCHSCNLTLGNVNDNIAVLESLIAYLKSHNVVCEMGAT